MIKKLKTHLSILFVLSVMLIFSIIFCILVHENINSVKKAENDFFSRIATCLIFTLENTSDYEKELYNVETNYDMYLLLSDHNHNVLYQSPNIFYMDTKSALDTFINERNKIEVYSLESTPSSSTSGFFLFDTAQGNHYVGMQCTIITSAGINYNLSIIKDINSTFEILKFKLPLYVVIWILVFASILFLAYFIVGIAVKPTEVASYSQKEFIASVSHELKSPLAVILSCAETIGNYEKLPEPYRHQTEIIDSECLRMSKLIQDLLLLSSIDTRTWSLNKTEINIDTFMIGIYEKFEPIVKKKKILFQLELEDKTFPVFRADADRLNQIIGIFLDNAITYSKSNTEILLKAETNKCNLIFTIIDHGQGISDENKPFIFDRFYCTDKSRTKKAHYGLGLSIAKELVTMHKGTIVLSDTEGGGCTFQIFIPHLLA